MKSRYFNLAENVAKLSDYPRIHIGSVIVKNKDVISVGQNMMKTHPAQFKYNQYVTYDRLPHIHSEVNAISKARPDLMRGATMYIFRRDRNGDIAMCRPCDACMQAIRDAGIKDVYYTNRNGFCYERII